MKSLPKWRLSKTRFRCLSNWNDCELLTLLSLALVELLLSFPFSLFLLLDLDLVIVFEVFDENNTDYTQENTQTGNGLFSHNASTKSARNLTANQQTGGAACKFHCWHKHQHVAYKNIARKSLGFRPKSILSRVNIEYPRRLGNF